MSPTWIYCPRMKSQGKRNIMVCFSCANKCQVLFEQCPALMFCIKFLKGKPFLTREEKDRRAERMRRLHGQA